MTYWRQRGQRFHQRLYDCKAQTWNGTVALSDFTYAGLWGQTSRATALASARAFAFTAMP